MRIHELAKQQEIPTREVLKTLSSIGIKNKKSASLLTREELEKFQEYIRENKEDKPEVALIKKKPKGEEEEHKKIVIKKKKVVILKKSHRPEPPKEKPKEKKPVKKQPERPHVQQKPKKPMPQPAKDDKKPVYKLKDKKTSAAADTKKGPPKKGMKDRKRYGFRRNREEEGSIDKILHHKRKDERIVANPIPKEIEILETITVGELARKMNLKASDLIAKLITLGVMARINDQIDSETATLVAEEYGCHTKVVSLYEETVIEEEVDKPEDLIHRPPVVTIMGHVDHGKTKLLDVIRDSNIVGTESGGITQHIGAYRVILGDKSICFLDTPGHEAFTMMRARGAKVTDIVVLVVAADDGVMPQTVEAIDHAKEAGVPMVVAINKIDIHGANPDKVRNELAERGVVPEEWGGDTLMVEVSALKKTGIDGLLEAVLLQADMLDLKANPDRRASGTIVESKIDSGRGIVTTVLIQHGTLKLQSPFIAGVYPGRVRAMFDENGKEIKEALPSDPVEVIGLSGMPESGDPFQVTEHEKFAKQIGQKRQELKRLEVSRNVKKITLENLYEQIKDGEVLELKVIIKADVQGSVEALQDSLSKLSTPQVRLNAIHTGVGAINKPDIILASASNAIVIGFRVRPNSLAAEMAKKEKVEIKRYSIIYDVIDDVKSAMEGLLAPELREEIVGSAEVRAVFKVPKQGNVAGSYVKSGRVQRGDKVRIIRDGIELYSGVVSSLRRFKEDAREVAEGFECGIKVENYDDIKEGDVFETFVVHEIARKLETNV